MWPPSDYICDASIAVETNNNLATTLSNNVSAPSQMTGVAAIGDSHSSACRSIQVINARLAIYIPDMYDNCPATRVVVQVLLYAEKSK